MFSGFVIRWVRENEGFEKNPSGYNSSCSPQLFNFFHRKAPAMGIVCIEIGALKLMVVFSQTDSKAAFLNR